MPSGTEEDYVHSVYDQIAHHFSQTRHSGWPRVEAFLRDIPAGDLTLDVGCGNGKYMRYGNASLPTAVRGPGGAWAPVDHGRRSDHDRQPRSHIVGLDMSAGLLAIAHARGAEVARAHAAQLACLRPGVVDHCICIATLHHLVARADRVHAVAEMLRHLNPRRGRILIVVWATELDDGEGRLSARRTGKAGLRPLPGGESDRDVLVPWTTRGATYERYYHFYEAGELLREVRDAADAARVPIGLREAYERDNWYVVGEIPHGGD